MTDWPATDPATWVRGIPLTDTHRERLLGSGVLPSVLDALALRVVESPLPEWWHENGNALYLRDGMSVPQGLVERMAIYPFRDALIVIATGMEQVTSLLLGGDGATFFIGPKTSMPGADFWCGAGSAIVINSHCVATGMAQIDARNGGSIVCAPDQLWAGRVYIATDDMHRFEDLATGERLNCFGAHITIGEHVWIGREAIVTGQVDIAEGCVVGLRSLVRNQKVPPHVAIAGTPAKVIREGVTWNGEDLP